MVRVCKPTYDAHKLSDVGIQVIVSYQVGRHRPYLIWQSLLAFIKFQWNTSWCSIVLCTYTYLSFTPPPWYGGIALCSIAQCGIAQCSIAHISYTGEWIIKAVVTHTISCSIFYASNCLHKFVCLLCNKQLSGFIVIVYLLAAVCVYLWSVYLPAVYVTGLVLCWWTVSTCRCSQQVAEPGEGQIPEELRQLHCCPLRGRFRQVSWELPGADSLSTCSVE